MHNLFKDTQINPSNVKVYAIRLRPNQDLLKELNKFVRENELKSAFVMTCVGSLTKATIRMAYSGREENEVRIYDEHMEIVSLVGTLSSIGGHHLHISLSDKDGRVVGGHVFGECSMYLLLLFFCLINCFSLSNLYFLFLFIYYLLI
jgi:uncharacterized protein